VGKVTARDVPFGKESAVLDAAGIRSGDLLSTKLLADARARILRHGLFGSVVFEGADVLSITEEERNSDTATRDVNIVVFKQRNWNLTLNPSWNSDRGYGFSTDFQRNNLTENGVQFLFNTMIAQEPYQNTASNGPSFGQVPGFSLSAGLREALFRVGPVQTPFDFNFITLGQEVDVRDERRTTTHLQSDLTWRPFWFGKEFTHRLELSYGFSGYPLGGVSKPVKVIDNSNNVGVIEVTVNSAIDTRNNPVWPRKGYTLALGLTHADSQLGSDVDYDKYSVDGSVFFPLTRSWTQAFFVGGKQVTAVKAPGNKREKISAAQVRGFPAIDSQLGPLLWYLEKDTSGVCVAKLAQAAATHLVHSRAEMRYRSSNSSWGVSFFYDAANAFFSEGEMDSLNSQLSNVASGADFTCPQNAARVIGNDVIRLDAKGAGVFSDVVRSSYQSAGVGFRLFLADMFALHLDWGIPTYDPNGNTKECSSYAEPYAARGTATSAPVAPTCISRKPQYVREWNSVPNGLRNALDFLARTQISIEGKF
jgi:outer membrane protein assembly factor BamA